MYEKVSIVDFCYLVMIFILTFLKVSADVVLSVIGFLGTCHVICQTS